MGRRGFEENEKKKRKLKYVIIKFMKNNEETIDLIQHLIQDKLIIHHYKLFITPRRVGVILLEREDLKESEVYSLFRLSKIVINVSRLISKSLSRWWW